LIGASMGLTSSIDASMASVPAGSFGAARIHRHDRRRIEKLAKDCACAASPKPKAAKDGDTAKPF
jgi:hypothetical protein